MKLVAGFWLLVAWGSLLGAGRWGLACPPKLYAEAEARSGVTRAEAGLTEAPRLAAVYDSILNAQFDRIDAELAMTCPPAPVGACQALAAEAVWWQILVDPDSRALDRRLLDLAEAAVDATLQWTRREPNRAEAWFYLAGSYVPRVQLRVARSERLAAARDGNRIRAALERSLQLDPSLDDAHFGIGLYRYYADVVPRYAKFLRWLMLPGGDRASGLREILLARDRGVLLRGQADFELHQIYLWYEGRSRDASMLLESLDARYPANPVFLERIADLNDVYFHDLNASAHAWRRLIDRARDRRVYAAALIEARAERKLRDLNARREKSDRALHDHTKLF